MPGDRTAVETASDGSGGEGARAILRVPEILNAVACEPGSSFASLRERLGLPKSSLHRLLRTLEQGGYLSQRAGGYGLGPASVRLSRNLVSGIPEEHFPTSVRPVLQWLAHESGESVMLALPNHDRDAVTYVDVINSTMPFRVTVPLGQTRPLYAAASGQAVLAFLPVEARVHYLDHADWPALTPHTLDRAALVARLGEARACGVVHDRNGSFVGASGIASPCFDAARRLFCAVSVSGPTDRLDRHVDRIRHLVHEGGMRISRLLGMTGPYPPVPPEK